MDADLLHDEEPLTPEEGPYSPEDEPFRPALDRDANTIEEHRVNNRLEALALYQALKQQGTIAWVECSDFQRVQQLEGPLAAVPQGSHICLFVNIPSDYPDMEMVEAELPAMMEDVLCSLWTQGLKLHLVKLHPK